MKRFVFPWIALILIIAITITGCSSTTSSTTPVQSKTTSVSTQTTITPQNGGVVRYALQYAPGNPTGVPWLLSGPTNYTSQLCLEPLLKEMADGSIKPNLATSYTIDAKSANPSITFILRKGVKFHDGTDFNAQAVKWNLDKQMGKDSVNLSTTKTWTSIDVVDDYTVRVNLKTWQNTLLTSFANNVSFMISPTAFETNGLDKMKYYMVGTGPFIQTDYQKDVSATAKRNPNYWVTGKPYLDEIQMVYVTDDMTRSALFKTGGCEILSTATNVMLASELKAAGYTVVIMPGSGFFALWPDSANADSPWSNIKVRMAAEYAIDKEAFAKTFGYGYLSSLNQLNDKGSIAYEASIPGRNYDVAKAKQLLSEAGFSTGFNTKMICSPFVTDRNYAVAIQSYLAEIGIKCEIENPTSAAYSKISQSETWNNGFIFTPVNLFPNPNFTISNYLSVPVNYFLSVKRPDGWQEMLNASVAAPEPDPVLLKKMEKILYDDVTNIPVMNRVTSWVLTNKVMDHGLGTFGTNSYWDPASCWLKK